MFWKPENNNPLITRPTHIQNIFFNQKSRATTMNMHFKRNAYYAISFERAHNSVNNNNNEILPMSFSFFSPCENRGFPQQPKVKTLPLRITYKHHPH